MKQILIIGTAHEFQAVDNPREKEFGEMLRSVVNNYKIQIILEEWNDNRGTAIGSTLTNALLQWRNVGTPRTPEYDTSGYINFDPLRPALTLPEYRFAIQEKREQFMVQRIEECMAEQERGLFIVGMNHLHSVMAKLQSVGFEVAAGNWLRIPDTETT